MRLSPDALNRLVGAKFTSEVVAKVTQFMCEKCNLTGAVSSALTFDFQKAEDPVTREEMIPVLTITLRPATVNNATAPEVLRDTSLPQQPQPGAAPVPGAAG